MLSKNQIIDIMLAASVFFIQSVFSQPAKTEGEPVKEESKVESNSADGLFAELQTTMGNITLSLEFEKTPITVINFVGLAEGTKKSNKPEGTPFYDGTIFHRVIDGFMIQGGDPTGTGMGGPGYRFPDETTPELIHDAAGILSMANAGPATNGSQFFITLGPTPHLNGKHTVFGRVTGGMEVVQEIAKVAKGRGDKPVNDIVINKIVITRTGSQAEAFKADEETFQKAIASQSKIIEEKKEEQSKEVESAANKSVTVFLKDLEKKHPGNIITTNSGLKYVVLSKGSGASTKTGDNVKIHYEGRFVSGEVFQSTYSTDEPVEFTVGSNKILKGLDEGVSDMKKGEKRLLVIPSDLAYGPGGHGPIPPFATLVFDIELLDF